MKETPLISLLIICLIIGSFAIVSCKDDSSPTEPTGIEEGEPGEEREFELANGANITLVWIPAGSFMMGRLENEPGSSDDEDPQHEVNITSGFWMGKYEVTHSQWKAVTGMIFLPPPGENRPVALVSWYEIHEKFLSRIDGDFRLPSESEWEYACRAGTQTRYYWGDDEDNSEIDNYAWHFYNSNEQTHDVGLKLPNAFGLYDMSGNVSEWCEDDFHLDYTDAPNDGSPWVENPRGDNRVMRGGCFIGSQWECRSAQRSVYGHFLDPYDECGFRLVLDP